MAGVKVTDLTALASAASDDVMYIVDSSSNQSKKIEVQNIFSGLPQFESGSFTPTVSDETDIIVTPLAAYYQRVNDVVNCSYYLEAQLDTGETTGSFNLSLPVASDFANAKDLFGIVSHNADPTELVSWDLSADTVNNKCSVNLESTSTAYGYQYIYIVAQYLVI
jgi:hypothetical protein